MKGHASQVVAIGAAIADSDAIGFGAFIAGHFDVPSGSSITSLTWYTCHEVDGTYIAAQDSLGALVQTVAASKSYRLPTDLIGARFLKAVGDAAGTIYVHKKG
jgi:hypothetical protein